jgi:alpha-tubulin suppressor-like RCC1 family protein
MATINLANLILKMQQKISNSTNEEELFYYSKVLQQARSGRVFFVVSLPNVNISTPGDLYYNNSNETLYVSTGSAWQSILSPTGRCIVSFGADNCGVQGIGGCSFVNNAFTYNQEITRSVNWTTSSVKVVHAAGVKLDGTLWAWGANCMGQLGNNSIATCFVPVQEVSKSTNWCAVSLGRYFSNGIKTDGSLWAWGFGNQGQLGNNSIANRCSPTRESSSSTNWCAVNSGRNHTLALKTTGTLWAWGINSCGMLGDGTVSNRSTPVQVGAATTWCNISAGTYMSAGVQTNGTLWVWGINLCGTLGTGDTFSQCVPVREASSSTNWCQVALANNNGGSTCNHTLALKTTGTLWGWGNNTVGLQYKKVLLQQIGAV